MHNRKGWLISPIKWDGCSTCQYETPINGSYVCSKLEYRTIPINIINLKRAPNWCPLIENNNES